MASAALAPSGNPHEATATKSQGAIEPDDIGHFDDDLAYGDEAQSYTTSLASSVYDYKYENGRRYNAFREGEYPLPNDEQEQDRLDLIHHLHLLILDGKLYLAPIKEDANTLDVGTGTGVWAVGFADEHPSAEVIGTDLSPIQPRWIPPNLRFEIDDAESDWAYEKKFDYIHLRTMGGSIRDVPRLLQQAYDHLNPGGWIEWQEYETTSKTDDNSFPPDSAMLKWIENLNVAADKFGKVMNIAPLIKESVQKAGFANVVEKIYKVPMTPWAKNPKLKNQGRYNQLAMFDSLQAYTLRLFTSVLGWKKEEAEALIAQVRQELSNPRIHMYST
ncbi:MAG: hypothetical protein M1816_002635 [Peltula sp. TS41687]|nr:MAG: hypothetical protein M1816_002635 [Peltula sp. TS41687]